MAVEMYFAWGQSSASVAAGETVSVSVTADIAPSVDKLSALFSPYAAVDSATTSAVVIRGVSAGSITVPANRDIAPQSSIDMTTYPSFTLTVTAPVEDESYLNKRGLTHFWENIDDIKQDKLTAGTGISITGNTISATGGGVADSVAWGHITGTMADQTDLNTALSAKVNSTSLAAVATSGAYSDLSGTPSLATVATSGSYNDLSNKPTIPAAQVNSDWNASSGVAEILNKPSLATVATTGAYSDLTGTPNLATVATSGSYNDLSNKPTIPAAQVQSDWTQATTTAVDYIKNKPNLATVATSGSYNDLLNKPTIPAAQVNSDWDAVSGVAQILNKPTLATVATSGSYNDLSNKPTIPTVNNATLTIQKNGTTVDTFTANASSNVTANITVPTATSDLTNDGADGTDTYVETADIADFITADDIASTSALTPPVQTNMIANDAVTTAKIDFSDYTMGSPTKASTNIDNPNAYNYYIKFGRLVIVHINIHATASINSGTDILTGFPVPIGRVCFALAGAGTRGMRGRILEGTGAFQCDDAMTENYYNGSCVYWSAA